MLLSKLATQKKIKDNIDNREYRIVTASDDGSIFFWNLPYDQVSDALQSSKHEKSSDSKKMEALGS